MTHHPNLMSRTQRWVLALTTVASLMVALDQLVVATALNSIRDDLHASITTLDWTVNAYSLSFAVLLITGAALGDRFGRRRLFVIGVTVFTAASAACALAPNAGLLIVARTVQGSGSALVMPLAVSLLTAAFPPERRGAAIGIFMAGTGLAVAGGPVVGGAVTEGIEWQWIFWINLPIGLALIPLAHLRIPESVGARTRVDVAGLALVSLSMFGLVWGLVRADAAGWSSAEVLTALTGGVAAGIAFVGWELRARTPMLPMHLFTNRNFAASNAAMLMLTGSLFGSVFFVALFMQVSLGYSPLATGVRFLPWTGMLFVVAPIAGRLADRIGARPLLVAGLALQGGGFAWIAHGIARGDGYTAGMVVALVVSGCGTSLALPAVQTSAMNSVAPAYLGNASGTFNTVRQLGGALGLSVMSAVFAARGGYASPHDFRDGTAPAMYVAAAVALAGAVCGLFVAAERPARVQPVGPLQSTPEVALDAVV